jgi:hypothetical protein
VIVTRGEDFGLTPSTVIQVGWVGIGKSCNDLLLLQLNEVWERLFADFESGAALVELR